MGYLVTDLLLEPRGPLNVDDQGKETFFSLSLLGLNDVKMKRDARLCRILDIDVKLTRELAAVGSDRENTAKQLGGLPRKYGDGNSHGESSRREMFVIRHLNNG